MIASSTAAAGGLSAGLGIVWIVVLFGIMYFMMIRPQKKEQKRTQTMLNSMEVGDSVVTTVRLSIRSMYSYVRLSIDRCTATYV